MNWPRYRLRSLLIAVVVAALLLGAAVQANRLRRTAAHHLAHAANHGSAELRYGKLLEGLADEEQKAADRARKITALVAEAKDDPQAWAALREQNERIRAQLETLKAANAKLYDYHARMRIKYERAAARPWITLAPDPPEPAPPG